jgi:hypothetical protein
MFVIMFSRISRMASSGSLEITIGFSRAGQDCSSALHGPGERNLSRRLGNAVCDAFDYGVVDDSGRRGICQRRPCLDDNPLFPTEVDEVLLREVQMAFDLDRRGLDAGSGKDLPQHLQIDIG